MSESFTTCPICRQRIDPEDPEAILAEKAEDYPGFGQEHDLIWTRVGYVHETCLVGARGYRPVAT